MDPLSIISGCAGLITAIGSLSISINTFVRSCREARSDLDRVSRELHSLQTVLELIEEDAKDDTKPFPPTIQHHVSGIVTNCGSVVLEVETCIKKYGDGRIKSRATWAINGQGDMEKLRSSLEAHKSALELALDMLSLSLTKEIKTNTTEIRNETAAIRDDTALILQEIAKLQARLPETAAAPNDYILQKFLEDMATYTETTLDVDLSYSDGMSSRALSIADEHDDSSTKSPQYNRPIIGHQDPAALVASQSSDSLHPRDTPKKDINHPDSPESHNHGHGKWPRTTREDIPHSPKRSSPLTSYLDLFHDKAVALGNDPQAPRLNALVSNPRNEETQDKIAPSPVRVHEDDSHRKHADSGTVQKDENSPNLSRTPTMPALNYSGGQSDQDKPRASKRVPQQPEHFVSTRSRLHQPQQVPYSTSTSPPTPTSEEDIIISPPETQVLSSIEGYHVQKLKGNIVIDLPAPERILDLVPHSPPPDRDEFTHTRFSLITCSPRGFATQSYPFRPALFAKPRETQFILVMQLDPNDKDFISRWDLIHDSIIYAQQKLEKHGASPDLFWKRVIVHLHLAHATKWGTRTADHPLTVLEAIGAKQNMNARVGNIESRYLDEPVENSSTIEGRRVHATISEYTVQLRRASFPSEIVPAKVPIQVLVTSARIKESSLIINWSDKFIPWTCAINKALQAQHVIDMSEISEAFLSQTDFLWEVLRRDRSIPLLKHKPLPAWDLSIFRFDSLVAEIQSDLKVEKISKKMSSIVSKLLKSRRA